MDLIKVSGCTVVSDGWSNIQGQPLLNVLAHTSAGVVFLKTHDSSGNYITNQLFPSLHCNVISFLRQSQDC
jgi:hypothetical protein